MRTKVLLLVAVSMSAACSNVEPAQTQGAPQTGSGANDGANGGQGVGTGGASSSRVSKAPSDSGGSSAKPVSKGGTSSTASATDAGGADDSQDGGTGGTAKSGSSKSSEGSGATSNASSSSQGSSAGGTKSSGKTSGSKSSASGSSSSGEGGTVANSGASNTQPAALGCDRAGLQAAVDAYLAALEAKDTSKMPLSEGVKYSEITVARGSSVALGEGLWETAQPVSFSRSLLDVTGCETFTEVFITESSHPYVLGTRLAIKDGKISEIYTIATDEDDWNFDAEAYATCSESEDWSLLPEASRSTREVLIAAGQAYFDIFSDKSTEVPWGNPCYRLEGGKGCTPQMDKASTTCNIGIPDGITFKDTHWVVDVDLGAVVGITLFAGASPDTHLFRLVDGKIRYVHTLTVMN